MKVLHLISSGGMYGAEAVILNLSRVLNARAGYASSLGVFSNTARPNLQLHHKASDDGIDSHIIDCSGQVDRRVPAAIRELVSQTGANVVHAHGYKADVYAYYALRDASIPLVSTCHTWYDNDWSLRVYGMVDRWVLRRFDGVVAVSEEVKRRLANSGVCKENVTTVRNGIDVPFFAEAERERDQRRREPGDVRFGLVGRLAPEKGVDIFLRAASEVRRRWPATKFFVAGDGPEAETLELLLQELGLQESAFLLGRRDNMLSFYASIDVLVSASLQEGLPIALLEGMASKLPVVATPVGAVPDVVRDGRTGLLAKSGDPVELAAAMERMLLESELRQSVAAAGREFILQEFSAERMTNEYVQLYNHVFQRHRARAPRRGLASRT